MLVTSIYDYWLALSESRRIRGISLIDVVECTRCFDVVDDKRIVGRLMKRDEHLRPCSALDLEHELSNLALAAKLSERSVTSVKFKERS